MVLTRQRGRLKNRIHATPAKYGITIEGASEAFGKRGRQELELLQTLPGVGFILAVVILLETGEVSRFPAASGLASCSGTTPGVHASGDKFRYGRLRPDVNRYLKWAFVEAANVICLNHRRSPYRH